MKVLVPGKANCDTTPLLVGRKAKCPSCDCVIEFEKSDVALLKKEPHPKGVGPLLEHQYVECPTCRYKIVLFEKIQVPKGSRPEHTYFREVDLLKESGLAS